MRATYICDRPCALLYWACRNKQRKAALERVQAVDLVGLREAATRIVALTVEVRETAVDSAGAMMETLGCQAKWEALVVMEAPTVARD